MAPRAGGSEGATIAGLIGRCCTPENFFSFVSGTVHAVQPAGETAGAVTTPSGNSYCASWSSICCFAPGWFRWIRW